jgi:hypothetical protein
MRRADSFKDRCLKGRRLIELLPFQDAERLPDDLAFVRVTPGVDEPVHKLVQRRRKGDGHAGKIAFRGIMSRSGWEDLKENDE